MKKATLISSMLTLASTAAVAGSLNLELRADYQGTSYNDAAKAGTTGLGQDNYKFFIPIGRLDAQGKLGSALDYRLRWRFSKPAVATSTPANNQNDSLNDSVDFAYVSHKPMDILAVTIGKFASQVGGIEGSTSGSDLFVVSPGNGGGLVNASLAGKAYYTGAKFETTMGDHKVGLHFANAAADVTNNNNKFAQTSGYTGLVYTGSFADGMVKPTVSYHTATNSASSALITEKNVGTYIAAGAMVTTGNVQVDLDLNSNTYTNGTIATNKDALTDIVLNVGYKMDNIKPSLKYYTATETIKDATEVKYTHTGMSAVVEFKPKMDENFRYHVAYNQVNKKADTAGYQDQTRTEVVAGVKIFADILK